MGVLLIHRRSSAAGAAWCRQSSVPNRQRPNPRVQVSQGRKLREDWGYTERRAEEVFAEETRHEAEGTVFGLKGIFGQHSFSDAVSLLWNSTHLEICGLSNITQEGLRKKRRKNHIVSRFLRISFTTNELTIADMLLSWNIRALTSKWVP